MNCHVIKQFTPFFVICHFFLIIREKIQKINRFSLLTTSLFSMHNCKQNKAMIGTSKWKTAKESETHRLKGFIALFPIEPTQELLGKPNRLADDTGCEVGTLVPTKVVPRKQRPFRPF